MTRPDLQQHTVNAIPFIVSKTNSSDINRESAGGGRVSENHAKKHFLYHYFHSLYERAGAYWARAGGGAGGRDRAVLAFTGRESFLLNRHGRVRQKNTGSGAEGGQRYGGVC